MLIPDSVFQIIGLTENTFILMAVLGLVVKQLKTPKGQGIVAGLETINQFVGSGVDYAEEALGLAKQNIGLLQERIEAYKAGAVDGVSLEEARVVQGDIQGVVESIQGIVNRGDDES